MGPPTLDSNFSNLEQNQFNKIYRAKTPRRKEKNLLFSELGVLASLRRCSGHALRESCFSDFAFKKRTQISNMFGWSFATI
jgi:hypothetical protein